MINYREILRLLDLGYTQREVSRSLHCSRNTVRDVLYLSKELNIRWPLDDNVTNSELAGLFHPKQEGTASPYREPDYAYMHRELARKGVNLTLLWSEYCTDCYTNGDIPYMYSQFCDKYRQWARISKATMRIQHKPGDVMQADWAGETIPIYDQAGGETPAYIFVAVLPCSCYAYVEACPDMRSESWLLCHVHAYSYFGGVTRLLIPDNLKTGVTSNTRYETLINKSYYEVAEYYDTAIVPARVEHPKDKSLAEGTVKFVSTWVIAALRNRRFFTLGEVQQAVSEKLEELNHIPFKKRKGNRHSAYIEEERDFMKQLPLTPYEPAVWSTAKVPLDYLISDGKNKYSVPYDLIGRDVDIRLTRRIVEVFFNGSRVALHPREEKQLRDPIVIPEHMPEAHRKYLSYNADDFMLWAKSIGRNTSEVVDSFLHSGREPEQGFKACASLTKLGEKYGSAKLEKACEQILNYAKEPNIRIITAVLKGKHGPGRSAERKTGGDDSRYGITRGAAYFSRKEDDDDE